MAFFEHVARLDESIPTHIALRCHINISLNRLPDRSWRRRPGCPRIKWLDQLWNTLYNTLEHLWTSAIRHGHRGGGTRL